MRSHKSNYPPPPPPPQQQQPTTTQRDTNAGVRTCAEAQTHMLRLSVADLESRAVAAALPHQLQLAVERYLQQHLAPTLKQVLADMVIDESLGTSTVSVADHHQVAAPENAHIEPFVPPREPPTVTVLSHIHTIPSLVDSPAVVALRESLAVLCDECAEAQTTVLQKDPSLSTPFACEARMDELSTLKTAGTRLTMQQRGIESAVIILRDARADVKQAEQQLAAAEKEQQREYEQKLLVHQQQRCQSFSQAGLAASSSATTFAASTLSSSSTFDHSGKLDMLVRLGFLDVELNMALLKRFQGDIVRAEQMLHVIAAQHNSSQYPSVSSPDVEMTRVSLGSETAPSHPTARSPHHIKPEQFPVAHSSHHVQSGVTSVTTAYPPPHRVKVEVSPFTSISVPSTLPLVQGHVAQSCAEALAIDGGRSTIPFDLLILYQCGFRAFDFTYRTSAVNHLKSLLRDKLSVSTEQLASGVWHNEARYNEVGVQEWQSWVDCTVTTCAGAQRICSARSNWNAAKTASTEEAAVLALCFMQRDQELKNCFLRQPPPISDINPVSAVRNAIRDRSAWKGASPLVLDEQVRIEQGSFHCRLVLIDEEIGTGSAPDKVGARTEASRNMLRRWNDAINYIRANKFAELQRYLWLELAQK